MREGLLLFLLTCTHFVFSGGIRGKVSTQKKEPLPFAGIFVKGTSTGTVSNEDGVFELALAPGRYEIVFQFLGFKAETRAVVIAEKFLEVNVELEEQPLNLSTVTIGRDKEDPAYTVMRRAIAKARFHELQLRGFTANAYTKSTGIPTKIPFLMERRLKKEGIQEGKAILNESLAEITYRRPNHYNQKILSTRNNINNSTPTPNEYILASFYSPEVANTITPLSPKAFAYYKFEYEGFFEERGEVINKIKVIPKSYGQGVFKGSIYIIEGRWAIHSFDLQTTAQGLDIRVRQIFNPIQNVWLPLSQFFYLKGGYLGFAGQFNYVVSMNYKKLDIDPALKEDIVIKDHVKEPETPKVDRRASLERMIKEQKEFSTKDFRKVIREYEKEERRVSRQKGEDMRVVRSDSITIDSLAHKRDTTYWATLRPVPLTKVEFTSYHLQDSLRITREQKVRRDSSRNDTSAFKPMHLLTGKTYRFGGGNSLSYQGPVQSIVYNTVEGFAFDASLDWVKRWRSGHRLSLRPFGRYAFGRDRLSGRLTGTVGNRRWSFLLEGGESTLQFNTGEPVSPVLNGLTSLLFERNYAKLYQKQFMRTQYSLNRLGDIITLSAGLEYARRTELPNVEGARPFINWRGVSFTPNRPENAEVSSTGFPVHDAMLLDVSLQLRPWQKYSVRNGRKQYRFNNGPTFAVTYRKGISAGRSQVDYDWIGGQVRHRFETGPRSGLQMLVSGGAFVNSRKLFFADFRHFMGNEFFFQPGDALSRFRMLPYYRYSTSSRFAQGHVLWSTQKFVLTQIQLLRLVGLKETAQIHYLATPYSGNYTELVYGVDGILQFFRAELVGQFQDFGYKGLGFRIGTVLNIR